LANSASNNVRRYISRKRRYGNIYIEYINLLDLQKVLGAENNALFARGDMANFKSSTHFGGVCNHALPSVTWQVRNKQVSRHQ
jgi:hypothetical protein